VRPAIALLPWGDVIEDFLDTIGISLGQLRDEYTGGWLFGYVDALATAGVDTVLVCVSRQVRAPVRTRHAPTGAELVLLPQSLPHRLLRRPLAHPYAWSARAAARGPGPLAGARAAAALPLAAYAATPVVALARELRRRRVAALLCQEYEYARFDVCTALGRALAIPVFATFQGGAQTRPGLEERVRPHAMAAAAGFVVAARGEARRLEREHGVPAARIHRIPNPVTHAGGAGAERAARRSALGLPEDAVVVAWHGRVELHRKGLDLLLDAWEALARRPGLPERRLLLIGTGTDAAALRARLAGTAGVTWLDRYLTDRAELAALLAAADLYAFPSRHEGFPVAPLEAMAGGLPVVAADAPGMVEILPGGEDDGGTIVPRDDPGALADALAALIGDPGRRAELGRNARRRAAEAFSPEAVGRALRRVLLGSMSRSTTRGVRAGSMER
jgi:glycosyltransferase involved in cell wall biosynthesis